MWATLRQESCKCQDHQAMKSPFFQPGRVAAQAYFVVRTFALKPSPERRPHRQRRANRGPIKNRRTNAKIDALSNKFLAQRAILASTRPGVMIGEHTDTCSAVAPVPRRHRNGPLANTPYTSRVVETLTSISQDARREGAVERAAKN